MAKYKFLLIIPLVAVLMLAWLAVASNDGTKLSQQRELLEQAAAYAADKVYVKAVPLAEEAYAIDTKITYTEVENALMEYYSLGEYTDEYFSLLESRINADRAEKEEYMELAEYYDNKRENSKCMDILEKAILKYDSDKLPEFYGIKGLTGEASSSTNFYSDEFTELYDEVRYSFTISSYSFEELYLWDGGYLTVRDGESGLWAIASVSGKLLTDYAYSEITNVSSDGFACAKLGNEYILINQSGTRYALCKDESVTELVRTESESKAVVLCSDGKMHMASDFTVGKSGYDYLGASSEGIRAITENGEAYLYSSENDGKLNISCDDIKLNSYGEAAVNGRIFIRQGNNYFMADTAGNIVDTAFEDAKPFASGGSLAAVQQNGKWGFADKSGNIVIKCTFEDAQSFSSSSIGLVKDGKKWKFITPAGKLIDSYEFDEASEFRNGCTTVKSLDSYSIVGIG